MGKVIELFPPSLIKVFVACSYCGAEHPLEEVEKKPLELVCGTYAAHLRHVRQRQKEYELEE